jgi:hypothetical protein
MVAQVIGIPYKPKVILNIVYELCSLTIAYESSTVEYSFVLMSDG